VNISAPAVHFALSSGTPTRYVKTAESDCGMSILRLCSGQSAELLAAVGDDHAALALLAAAGSLAAFCVG
jgi:hypothetical protein